MTYTPEKTEALLPYHYRKRMATIMRKSGFKFRPVCKDASLENLTKCNYIMEVEILNRKVTINLTI